MAPFGPLATLFRVLGVVRKLIGVVVVTVVGWLVVGEMVQSGQLPPAPLGLAEMGLPPTLVGLPTAYVAGILLLDAFVLFGESGGGSSVGHGAGHDGGFGDGGDGGGGGGGGDGGE